MCPLLLIINLGRKTEREGDKGDKQESEREKNDTSSSFPKRVMEEVAAPFLRSVLRV